MSRTQSIPAASSVATPWRGILRSYSGQTEANPQALVNGLHSHFIEPPESPGHAGFGDGQYDFGLHGRVAIQPRALRL